MPDLDLADVIQLTREASDTETLWSIMRAYFQARAVTKLSYHFYRGVLSEGTPDTIPITVRAEGFSEDWVKHYVANHLFEIDPIPDLARSVGRPFFWSEVSGLARLSDDQRRFLAEMDAADLGDGLAMHVYGPQMRNAYVGLGFGAERPALTSNQVTEFLCVAQVGHLRVCDILSDADAMRFDLSPREREILHWIARGKSNSVIAQILDVSPHTIDTLTRRLFDKLGVTDRTSAAIRGVGAGLILP